MDSRVTCKLCGNTFKNRASLRSHYHYAHKKEKLSTIDLHIHPKIKDDDALDNYLEMNNNLYDENDFKKFKGKLKMKNKHRVKPYAFPKQDVVPPSEPGPSSNIRQNSYQCHICKNIFENSKDRGDHIETSHPLCNQCLDRFPSISSLQKHKRSTHPQTIKCPVCQKVLNDVNSLLTHIKVHPSCSICGEHFTNLARLKRHEKKHSSHNASKKRRTEGESLFICNFCGRKDFRTIEELYEHKQQRHSHQCGKCAFFFVTQQELERHTNEKHSTKDISAIFPDHIDNADEGGKSQDGQNVLVNDGALIPSHQMVPINDEKDDSDLSDNSQSTLDGDKRLIPSHQVDEEKDDWNLSDNTLDNNKALIPSHQIVPINDEKDDSDLSDNSQSTLDGDKRLIPSHQVVEEKDDWDLSDNTLDDNKVPIPSHQMVPINDEKDDWDLSDYSQSTLDGDRRLISSQQVYEEKDEWNLSDNSQRTLDSVDGWHHPPYNGDVHDSSPPLPDMPEEVIPESIDGDSERSMPDGAEELEEKRIVSKTIMKKCKYCHKKFPSLQLLLNHLKIHDKRKKRKNVKSCRICKKSFKTQTQLLDHTTLAHPRCSICRQTFLTEEAYLVHLTSEHPERNFTPEESESSLSGDELDDIDENYRRHINCVTIERFQEIRQLILNHDFRRLTSDRKLLHALSVIMRGVKNGYIPLCTTQRMIMSNDMKRLLYKLSRNPSADLVLKEKQTLSQLFNVLWNSVKYISDTFTKYQ